MAQKTPPLVIAVPDDFPSVFDGTVAHERARQLGDVRVVTARGADDEAELIRRIDRARVAINIRAHARFTEGVFAACRNLELVSIWGTGTDNVDLEAAGRHGVTVTNTPGTNAFAVAEHTLALMLALARRIPRIEREMREGQWPRELLDPAPGQDGRRVRHGHHRRARGRAHEGDRHAADGASACAATPSASPRRAPGRPRRKRSSGRPTSSPCTCASCRRRAASSGAASSALMKRTALLINTARGALVEREALLDTLVQGKIAGAALDVFHDEPLKPGDPLLTRDNVVLSPHNAGQTPEVIRDGLLRAVQNVEAFLAGQPTDVVVAPVK